MDIKKPITNYHSMFLQDFHWMFFENLKFSKLDSMGDFNFKFYSLFPVYMIFVSPWKSE